MAQSSNPVFSTKTFKDQMKAGRAADSFQSPSAQSLQDMYNQPSPSVAYGPGGGVQQGAGAQYGARQYGGQQYGGQWGMGAPYGTAPAAPRERMSLNDVLNKMLVLFGVILVTGAVGWFLADRLIIQQGSFGSAIGLVGATSIAAMVIAIVNQLRKVTSPALSVVYAALEGVALGSITGLAEAAYPGIAIQAIIGTFLVFGITLGLYRSGKYRATPRMTKIVMTAAWAYLGFSLINFVLAWTGVINLRTGWIGLLVGVFAVALATYFLVMDFTMIQEALQAGAPKNFAWTCAFGLTVTLVWIYVEILRILMIIRSMVSD